MAANGDYFRERAQLGSGLLVLFYVFTHFLNHALGIFGLEAIEGGRRAFLLLWRTTRLDWLVVLALVVHGVLTVSRLARRTSFRGLRSYEWVQLATGLILPTVLIYHVIATMFMHKVEGYEDSYTSLFVILDERRLQGLIGLLAMLSIAWVHGMIGLRHWLELKPWHARVRRRLDVAALVVPLLAACGVISGEREAHRALAADPSLHTRVVVVASGPLDGAATARLHERTLAAGQVGVTVYLGLLALVFGGRWAFLRWRRSLRSIRIAYPGGAESIIFPGMSLLEASLHANIPHAHVCGGRGRCSTCRIRVDEGMELLEPPTPKERAVLHRIGADPRIRLACQTYLRLSTTYQSKMSDRGSERRKVEDGWRQVAAGQGLV